MIFVPQRKDIYDIPQPLMGIDLFLYVGDVHTSQEV
jgi:hypothetical protein